MPTQPCDNNGKIIAQTLFLGASVSSFNTSVGWGSQPSQLTVNLIEDETPCTNIRQFPTISDSKNTINHYHDCVGDDCYISPDNTDFDSTKYSWNDRIVPGKVYYQSSIEKPNKPIVSYYWFDSDPGFFGRKTRIKPDGQVESNNSISYQYDIIDTPVYFKMGNFNFCGLVQSWNRNLSSGGKNYTVIINSMQSLLSSCYLIIDKYAGSIFSRNPLSTYGSPKNYLGGTDALVYNGSISEGNLPNVFNIYGFLESFGVGGFGVARTNERGMSANKIVDALHILTSVINVPGGSTLNTDINLLRQGTVSSSNFESYAPKKAFSPFGRILAKHAQLDLQSSVDSRNSLTVSNMYQPISDSFNRFGLIPPSNSSGHCEFILDLSELPRTPNDFRINGPIISIMDLINTLAEETGHDVYIDTIPTIFNNEIYYVIKVKTISRLSQPRTNLIENTIKEFECNSRNLTSVNIGKEKNETNARSLIIGGAQQRLYQTKSYRLAYTQNNFIYDDLSGNFIDYMQPGTINNLSRVPNQAIFSRQFNHGKIKYPNFLSTRNTQLSSTIYSTILDDEDQAQQALGLGFNVTDLDWSDHNELSSLSSARKNGNYLLSKIIKQDNSDFSSWGLSQQERWFPIHLDTICPFFGFVQEEELTLKFNEKGSFGDFKKIRPVWFDTWTGQTVIVLRIFELPETSLKLKPIYTDNSYDPCADYNPLPPSPPSALGFLYNGQLASIAITNPGNKLVGSVDVNIQGDGTGATAIATVSQGRVTSVQVTNAGQNYTNATVSFTYNAFTENCLTSGQPDNRTVEERRQDTGYFILTESEIRAAISGFDNFLIYSLAKLYKPDLIEMVRRAYKKKIKEELIRKAVPEPEAELLAEDRVNWYWNVYGPNVGIEADGDPKPAFLSADVVQGDRNIPEEAIKDLQILHKFVSQIGQYYGKKYMVSANNLYAYKDEDFQGIVLQTQVGNAYVFGGPGEIKYNYTPTNDGAWEEYGSFIDDSIVVGSPYWYNLTDDYGKIRPIVGYNANYYFDAQRYLICQTKDQDLKNFRQEERFNEYWDFDSYISLIEQKNSECNVESFVFPSLDISNLSAGDFVLTDVIGNNAYDSISNISNVVNYNLEYVKGYDAFGRFLNINKRKLYVNTSVEESFVFLNPETFQNPKIIIDAPGITLNHSSSKNVQDPSRTVIANISIEDLSLYLKTTNPETYDGDWVSFMLSNTKTKNQIPFEDNVLLGLYGNKSNQSALMVEMAPKAAHPFFVAIPIKSNQFTYGPWTNYPYLEYTLSPTDIFPSGKVIVQDSGIPPTCSSTSVQINALGAKNAIDNWITPISIDIKDDFVPWLYGGTTALDTIAYKEIETKINYQTIIETAQLEMPGLPEFNLGGNFAYGNLGLGNKYNQTLVPYTWYDEKDIITNTLPGLTFPLSNIGTVVSAPPSNSTIQMIFNILYLRLDSSVAPGPIITNIQTTVGQQGITTNYSFRTYTRKIGLFNKEESDRIKRDFQEKFRRNKQFAEISQELKNITTQQRKFIDDQRLENAQFGTQDFSSKLYGYSPVKAFVGRASTYMREPIRDPNRQADFTLQTDPGDLSVYYDIADGWSIPAGASSGLNTASTSLPNSSKGLSNSIKIMSNSSRIKADIGLYDIKEADSQMPEQYGLQSVMSLDGLLSPISFYPTLKNATFSFSKFDTKTCPFCGGTKVRLLTLSVYYSDGNGTPSPAKTPTVKIYCDKCVTLNEKLNNTLKTDVSTAASEVLPPYILTNNSDFDILLNFDNGITKPITTISPNKIPINLVTLHPIVVPNGEFKNSNVQNYEGAHPAGAHRDITSESPAYNGIATKRQFRDRLNHSIEIIGRGSVRPGSYSQYSLETSKNMTAYNRNPTGLPKVNLDYNFKDLLLQYYVNKSEPNRPYSAPDMNQRFFGLRGPLMLHAWGYDIDGYPIPNAADEPLAIDQYGRKKRFKLSRKIDVDKPVPFKSLPQGKSFILPVTVNEQKIRPDSPVGLPIIIVETNYITDITAQVYGVTFNKELLPSFTETIDIEFDTPPGEFPSPTDPKKQSFKGQPFTENTLVFPVTVKDDYSQDGGFDPLIYQGSVISKTQAFNGSRWTTKKKMNEFHLNWAERQDLWKVGPIDLRWDDDRKVWTAPPPSVYKFVYVTLEEDLVREQDFIETYPAKGFLDDIEYSKDVLETGFRKLVYIKDRSGYTAPRGVKLLCRYDKDSGFYEPISKPSIITTGTVQLGNKASIEMNYVQGRQSGQIPVSTISFEDTFNYKPGAGKKGMFTYMGGKWILTSVQQ